MVNMGVSIVGGGTQVRWMVYLVENPIVRNGW